MPSSQIEIPFSQEHGNRGPQTWKLLSLIVLLGATLRIVCVVIVPSPLVSDYLDYWTLAKNLYSGRGLVDADGNLTAFMSPGYPIILAAFFATTGPSMVAVKAMNVLLGVLSIILLFLLAHRMFRSLIIAAIAAFFLAVYVESIVYTAYVAKENLLMPLMIGMLWIAADRSMARNLWVNPIAFGLLIGAIIAVGNAALALVPAALLLIWLCQKNCGRVLRYLLIATVASLLIVVPLLGRNHEVFGAWVMNNNGGFNLYIGNFPEATPYFSSITETPIAPQWERLRTELGEHGVDVLLRRLAIAHILEDPSRTAMLMVRKAIAFWNPPTHIGIDDGGMADNIVRAVWLLQFVLAGLLCLFSISFIRRLPSEMIALILSIAGYTAIHTVFYVIYRYRLPIMPFVFLGASVFIYMVSARLKGHGWAMRRMRRAPMLTWIKISDTSQRRS